MAILKSVLFFALYSVIILEGLRASAIPQNVTEDKNELTSGISDVDFIPEDAPLSFLNGFIFEETGDPLELKATKKIAKRSISPGVVPQYMIDLYEQLSDKRYKVKFDTARSYRSQGSRLEKFHLPHSNGGDLSGRRLIFNISSFPRTEKVQLAQLRIQAQPQIPAGKVGIKVKTEIYGLHDAKTTLVESRDTILSRNSLLTLNLTALVQRATENWVEELHFAVTVTPLETDDFFIWDASDEAGPQLLLLSKETPDAGPSEDPVFRRLKRSLAEKLENLNVAEDALDDRYNRTTNSPVSRTKRSEEEDEEFEEQSNYIVEELGRIRKGKLKKKKNPCRRKPLVVNFADINYDQWIIAPPSYDAFECTGKCSFPMSAHLTPTKHAIIQTLMHSLEPKQIARACCVPTQLTSISVLYIDDDGVVTYKYDYEDMVVSECGCR